jgi:hypothetical protein
MNPSATGVTTPAAKRLKLSTAIVPVTPAIEATDLALALAYVRRAEADAAAAATIDVDAEMNEDPDAPEQTPNETQQVPQQHSLESLPSAFTLFAVTISKKVTGLLMAKRAKRRVVAKLEQRETIPSSIRFNFELTGSKEVTGNSDFFDLTSACGMAIITCQTELKTYMVRAAAMEIEIFNEKYRAVFYQALKGFSHLLLINRGMELRAPTETLIRELACSSLEQKIEYFTGANRFHLRNESLFSDYKDANEDGLPTWTVGTARPTFLADYTAEIDALADLMHSAIIQPWLEKVLELQEKEKTALLQSTQRAFFKTVATRETAANLAKETTMDETKMDAVIADKIATETKDVRATLSKLENMIRRTTLNDSSTTKNSKGGAKQAERASRNKKTNPNPATKKKPPPKKQSRSPRDADAADAAANASSRRGNGKNSKTRQKNKPGKKGKQGGQNNA